jgi:isopenicillin N synthase-like dioxygenase
MHLSSDRFKSTFHRVRAPHQGERYSLAWFIKPKRGTRIGDSGGKYDECSAEEFILGAMRRNYEAYKGGGTEYTRQRQST